ncbi:MAG: 4Fe-4S dicluster domain-containing protein [Bdellovibrionales bacterium]|nr:4Fe-4S dicluster domain-containing protein [Bdellovibrionales bacterium]
MSKIISYKPTEGLSYHPNETKYWDWNALEKELHRAYALCESCRMCFKFCDTFPDLFSLLDKKYEGDPRKISLKEHDQLMDSCFQCKLCEVQCPYTPRDKHEFQLDFPKLVHRYQALRKKSFSIRRFLLSKPDFAGWMARLSFGTANIANRVPFLRWLMEKGVGIHREKLLPDFAAQAFDRQAKAKGLSDKKPEEVEVVLFQTCYVQNNEPSIGFDTIEVLQQNQISFTTISGFVCCGMPSWEHGDLKALRAQAHQNLSLLKPYLEKDIPVIAINPTCSMMLRAEYQDLLEGEDQQLARKLSTLAMDPSEYLWSKREDPRFNDKFKSSPGSSVSYHVPCHLRAQGKGFRAREIMRKIPGLTPKVTMECCGHNGTYAMKKEHYCSSVKIGQKAFDSMKQGDSEVWVTDCPLAAIQFQQHAGKKPMHPMTFIARAYQEKGFSLPVVQGEKNE